MSPSKRSVGGYRPNDVFRMIEQLTRQSGLPPVGLIAGWGAFPVEVAQRIVSDGRQVCCVAITGHADPRLESICDHVAWLGVGKLGGMIRYFKRFDVQQITMAGKLFKSKLIFRGATIVRHMPDWCAIKTFGPHLFGRVRDARDDSILTSITNSFSAHSLAVHPATDFAPELLVNQGLLAGKPPKAAVYGDIKVGWRVAKEMGGMDIGQSVTVKDGTVIAVEAVEGTDACLRRTGQLCRRGWTLVKVSKPSQDMRFDVPTIGPQTIENVRKGGGIAIAIEAGKTILVQREETLKAAARAGISLISMHDPAVDHADLVAA